MLKQTINIFNILTNETGPLFKTYWCLVEVLDSDIDYQWPMQGNSVQISLKIVRLWAVAGDIFTETYKH